MDLFDYSRQQQIDHDAPLAARMRPRTLDEYVGQGHIIGPGRLLRRAIQADQLSSLIFYGPPGTGKTTLATVIAHTTQSNFITINAVLAGVKDIREAIATAQEYRGMYGQRTLLFVDEVHRWNKAQQDALLPWVENGTIILIGATTENPYFSVNRPLVSRSRIFQLQPLDEEDLRQIAWRAIRDPEYGYGKLDVDLHADALDHLVNVANGDARGVLNALELAVETTPPNEAGVIVIDSAVAEESIQKRAVLYDKDGDTHYDTISAFIKSLRGSDPDAALYWLAKMVYAGEDPRFIFRRMLIFAGEDVGLADPNAVQVVNACAQTFDRIGLPEGRFHLAEATLYLATAPKSNSAMAFFDALATVENEREGDIPAPLRDGNRDKEGFGHGQGYLYPHAYRDHWVAQQYLPTSLQGKVFYTPSDQGYEKQIRHQVMLRREAQLAAMLDSSALAPPEVLTFSPADRDRWLQRAIGAIGEQLGQLRDRVLSAIPLQRHHVVLDLNASTGLLTWEAARRVPEGGVWSLAENRQAAEALQEQAARLDELDRPHVLCGSLQDLPDLLAANAPAIRFDAIVGRNVLTTQNDSQRARAARTMHEWLVAQGMISLVQVVPRHTQRLYQLVEWPDGQQHLEKRVADAEEDIYKNPEDNWTNWDIEDLRRAFIAAGFDQVDIILETQTQERLITRALFERWFDAQNNDPRPTYAQHLLRQIERDELPQVRLIYERSLLNQTALWTSRLAFITAKH
ncbi:MAG: AAA family ATPase [Anaerolineae bacterium]|nr:AAA family ATPase [Anaerolineae bacterium]